MREEFAVQEETQRPSGETDMSEAEKEFARLGAEIDRMQGRRSELLNAECARLTGANIGDIAKDRRGRLGVIVAWDKSDFWPHSPRDRPWVRVRRLKKSGEPGDQQSTFFDWTKESPADERDGAQRSGARPIPQEN